MFQKVLSITLYNWILQDNGFKELKLVLFESLFLGLHILLYNIFCQTIYWRKSKAMNEPQKTFKWPWKIKVLSASSKLSLWLCVPPWRRATFKFWEMLKNASGVTLVPKEIITFFINFVQSFVECKVSLADGISQVAYTFAVTEFEWIRNYLLQVEIPSEKCIFGTTWTTPHLHVISYCCDLEFRLRNSTPSLVPPERPSTSARPKIAHATYP